MSSFGINGIGYNPMMSGLGTYGLGSSGSFGTYADPMTMGMMGMSPYSMGGLGMMGMYNPSFMAQYNQIQQEMEKSQLNHASAMHDIMLQNKTQAFTAEDRALFEKAMVDAGVNLGIENLSRKVKEGDQDGICEEFDKLKRTLYAKYGDYFKANSHRINADVYASNFIEILYSKIRSAQEGVQVDLRGDINKYGESAFEHGFRKNFFGKDYHERYTAETMNYLFGTSVDNKAGKDRMEKVGATIESGVEYATAPVVGALAGAGVAGTAAGLGKMLTPDFISNRISWNGFKNFSKLGAAIGAIGLLAADIWWQNSRA